MQLNNQNLGTFTTDIGKPKFDRNAIKPSIVHIGVGNFHRSHQAVYIQELLNQGGDPIWGLRGAGIRETDAGMRARLEEQDWLYSIVEVDTDVLRATIIGSMIDFVPIDTIGNAPLVSALADRQTRIVSLTVTEGGYFLDASGKFNPNHSAIRQDVDTPSTPSTVFGVIVAALAMRKEQGLPPFTVMSCDNLPGNGDITRDAILSFAGLINADLAKYIEREVTFPNGMVDRITPVTTQRERDIVQSKFGISDDVPVFCEPFSQWVLEDKFVAGRPELERVGVVFTDSIHDFENLKIRILNGGHAIMAYAAAMLGMEYVNQAMATPLVRDFLRKVLTDDVLHLMPSVTGFTPQQYLDLVCQRFSNPGISDTIERLCFDGSNRQPKFVIPSIRENLDAKNIPTGLALSSALWCAYCAGKKDNGQIIHPNDPAWDMLHLAAKAACEQPEIWIGQQDIYGTLGSVPEFQQAFAISLKSICAHGAEATIRDYLNDNLGHVVA